MTRRLVHALLARMRNGRLTIVEGGRRRGFGSGAPRATVHVHSPRTWPALLRGGRGLAESYAAGHWDSPDLTALIRVAARNTGAMDAIRRRLTPVREPTSAPAPRSPATRRPAAGGTSRPTTTSATTCSR